MRIFLSSLLGLATAVSLLECSDKPSEPVGVKLDQPFTLKYSQSATVEGENLTVTFDSVLSDSRCPLDVACFWGGMAEIEITMEKPRQFRVNLPLAIMGGATDDDIAKFAADTLAYRIQFLRLGPYPRSIPAKAGIIPDPYQATLKISRSTGSAKVIDKVQITNLPPESIQLDQFDLDTATISGDTLFLAVSYGGGCKKHYFFLYMSPASFHIPFSPPFTAEANLYLKHYDNGDACRSCGRCIVEDTLLFDVSPIAELYSQVYQEIDPIILNVFKYLGQETGEKITLIYGLPGAATNKLIPAALGNYRVYEVVRGVSGCIHTDSVSIPFSVADTTLDSVAIIDYEIKDGETWWLLSGDLWPIGDRFLIRGDTIFSKYAREFIVPGESSLRYHPNGGGPYWGASERTAYRGSTPLDLPVGIFDSWFGFYERTIPDYNWYRAEVVVVPGVGIATGSRSDMCSPMSADQCYCHPRELARTLVRFHVEVGQ